MIPEYGQYIKVDCTIRFFFQKIHNTPQNSGRHKNFHTADLQIIGASIKETRIRRTF